MVTCMIICTVAEKWKVCKCYSKAQRISAAQTAESAGSSTLTRERFPLQADGAAGSQLDGGMLMFILPPPQKCRETTCWPRRRWGFAADEANLQPPVGHFDFLLFKAGGQQRRAKGG